MPDLFTSSDVFDDWYAANNQNPNAAAAAAAEAGASLNSNGTTKTTEEMKQELDSQNLKMVQQLHKILQPFMLRRTKM
jgi:SWI/SNF-related matrix-associated actin-dependent regulator of chromatin subfamily A member 5